MLSRAADAAHEPCAEGHWWQPRRVRLEAAAAARAAGCFAADPAGRNPDTLARHLAGPVFGSLLARPLRGAALAVYERTFPGLYAFHIARTRHIDEILAREIAAGLPQLVLLGAGFDTRSHRFAAPLARTLVFELDYPRVLAWKQRRLARFVRAARVIDVPADLDCELPERALIASGLDPHQATLFVWENVTPYLSPRHVERVFSLVRSCAPGSALVFDYVERAVVERRSHPVGAREQLRYAARKREPYVFGFDPAGLGTELAAHGLSLVSNVHATTLAASVAPRRMLGYAAIAHARVPLSAGAAAPRELPAARVADRLPPGPGSALLATLRYAHDPFRAYRVLREKYGDPVLIPTLHGPLVVTGEPDGAKAVFSADAQTFDVFGRKTLGAVFGPCSVMMLDGDAHRRERKLLSPPFHAARMRTYARMMQETALRCTRDWKPGAPFAIQRTAKAISREIIIRAVFGVVDDERIAAFQTALTAYARANRTPLIFFEPLRRSFAGLGPWDRFARATSALDALLYAQIEARVRNPAAESEDVLSLLLAARYDDGEAMSDAAIRDELMALTLAGYATTAIALSWAMFWLHRTERALARVRTEIESVANEPPSALAALPYLDAVCHETLRMHPLIPDVFRMLRRPLDLRGYRIPAGYGVAVSTSLLHARDEVFPEPDRFVPERFIVRTFGPTEYVPFGGGTRRCLGAAFGLFELKIVLGTILRHYELELAGDERPARQGLAVGPQRGVRMRLLRRR